MKKSSIRFVSQAGMIGALYVALTMLSALLGLSSGVIQCRFSEALTILPFFTFSAVPGLFLGCLIANIISGGIIIDVIFGSVATLIGAVITYLLRNKSIYLAPVGPIVSNTLIIPFVLKYAYHIPDSIFFLMLTVFLGELISCGIFGLLFYFSAKKRLNTFFKE